MGLDNAPQLIELVVVAERAEQCRPTSQVVARVV